MRSAPCLDSTISFLPRQLKVAPRGRLDIICLPLKLRVYLSGRASRCQRESREFDPRHPLSLFALYLATLRHIVLQNVTVLRYKRSYFYARCVTAFMSFLCSSSRK